MTLVERLHQYVNAMRTVYKLDELKSADPESRGMFIARKSDTEGLERLLKQWERDNA